MSTVKNYEDLLNGASFYEAEANNAKTERERSDYWLQAATRWQAAAGLAENVGIGPEGIALLEERAQKCYDNRKGENA